MDIIVFAGLRGLLVAAVSFLNVVVTAFSDLWALIRDDTLVGAFLTAIRFAAAFTSASFTGVLDLLLFLDGLSGTGFRVIFSTFFEEALRVVIVVDLRLR